ncbi:MAG: DUF3500 domain-containing protein [Bacteroidetes bacterium]|nr:DUF3500 domain-containing protein [Bacteroidota bacterium]
MKTLFIIIFSCLLCPVIISAQESVKAAKDFIGLLNADQKSKALFPFDGDERYQYHYVPIERKGITFNEMNEAEKAAAFHLLQTCLGNEALQKTKEIMQLENVLKALEQRKPDDHFRDAGNYHISIFGIPANNTIWGWRFEGHHVSFNFSFDKKKLVSGTPGFLGSNPAIVLSGPQKGTQVLKDEEEMGFGMLHSLSSDQRKRAIVDTLAPADIVTFQNRVAMIEHPTGILYSELNPEQQQKLLGLINLYIHRFTKLFADDMLKEITAAGLENLRFAWAGYTDPVIGKGAYYRVQGPTVIIEYDNTQNNANHVHSVVRDLKHDFGGDELLEHYKQSHAK